MDALSKLEVARRQLGTALWLFLEDLDPVSVHILAGAGAELADGLAREVRQSAFVDHVLRTNPNMTAGKYYGLARQYYNALKHLTKKDGEQRSDEELLANFNDQQNDAHLFIAWSDLTAASPSSPIEAQVFQVWFYACHPDKMAHRNDAERFLSVFPDVAQLSREDRKAALKEQIARARADARVMADPRTDRRSLVARASGW
jgi:hypothetical protein